MNRHLGFRPGLALVSACLVAVAGIASAGTTAEGAPAAEVEPPDPLVPWRGDAPSALSPPGKAVDPPGSTLQSPLPIPQLLDEAERAYRARQWSRAMDAYKAIVARVPEQRHAWLRIGNLHHQRQQFASAAFAYRRASARAAGADAGGHRSTGSDRLEPDRADATGSDVGAADLATRNKALVNLALVNLEFARLALEDVRDPSPTVEVARDGVARELESLDARARGRLAGDGVVGPARGRERGSAVAGRPSVEYLRGAPSP